MAKSIETLRQKDAKGLRAELLELQTNLQKARVDIAFGRLKKNSDLKMIRTQIARVQTILNEKEVSHA